MKFTKTTKRFSILIIVLTILSICFHHNKERIYMSLGSSSFGDKFYNISIAEFSYKQASKLTPAPRWANYQLSRINFIKGDQYKAVWYADKELKLYPDNCRTNYIRGLAYAYADNLVDAIKNFNTFNDCFPDSWAGHNDLAWFYFRKGDYNSAKITIEKIQNKYPVNPWVQNSYGVALMNTGDYINALNAFTKAKISADKMTEEDWGTAYPGNEPSVYGEGLTAMRNTIDKNIILVKNKMSGVENNI